MYEGLTVNADLPEQLFSFTDGMNKKNKKTSQNYWKRANKFS